jgi:hypothetical protein
MREVKPYITERGLMKSLDNGGRFYNLFTKAGDDQITRAELAKAAGVFGSASQTALFFEMSQHGMSDAARKRAVQALGPKASKDYRKHRPIALRPSAVDSQGKGGQGVIVQGYPRFMKNKTQFTGMMMLPIQAGNVTTFMMIPLYDHFDLYEVFDDARMRKPFCVLATTRGVTFSAKAPVRFAGALRTMEAEEGNKSPHKFYLEVCYYTHLDQLAS